MHSVGTAEVAGCSTRQFNQGPSPTSSRTAHRDVLAFVATSHKDSQSSESRRLGWKALEEI